MKALRHPATRVLAGCVVGLLGFLWMPDCDPEIPESPGHEPFAWDRDGTWEVLEARFAGARPGDCSESADALAPLDDQLGQLIEDAVGPEDPRWDRFLTSVFTVMADAGGCADKLPRLDAFQRRVRQRVKDASRDWPQPAGRRRLYTLSYGLRAAIEELWLQHPDDPAIGGVSRWSTQPAETPSVEIEGVQVHSGDLLVSRGGAPTSAFIARGNDYPGNFSHVALAHVGEDGQASVIEAHIERGVTVASAAAYLADKKLRILVLRLHPDHPALVEDPLLPHRAATAALEGARERHIPYDFAMDFRDPATQFCSEVAFQAYRGQGVELWKDLSSFSSPGLARWMAGFGVEHLETQAPSDLEYDSQLVAVAEWHDPETLFDDHLDNAVIDAMLARAEAGADLEHDAALLPLARVAKAYSVVLNLVGKEGPVPEGMSATVALRAEWLAGRHGAIRARLVDAAGAFERSEGYRPPYWRLVAMAHEAAAID